MPTSYLDFELEDLAKLFGINNQRITSLLKPIEPIEPSQNLTYNLALNLRLPLKTEKAKSELIIMPVLIELWSRNKEKIQPYSGYTLNIDSSKGLNGRCDYILTSNPTSYTLDAPIISIFEAKNDNIDDWLGQCGAEMYASRLFNQQKGNPIEVIHGAVTNGFDWLFLKLEENIIYIDTERYALRNLAELLGALQKVVDYY